MVVGHVRHGGLGCVLMRRDDGRDDAVALRLDVVARDARLGLDLVESGLQEVTLGAGEDILVGVFDGLGERGLRVALVLRDELGVHHAVQHVVPPELGLIVVHARVPRAGSGHQAREHRGLGQLQVGGVLVVILARRGLDAVGAAAQVDGVEVVLENLVLGLLLVDLERHQRLVDLAGDRRGGLAHVVPLHVLLRDGGAAARVIQHDGVPQRLGHARDVDAGVGVERAVLGRHEGLRHVLGKRLDAHRLAVRDTQTPQLRLSVRVVEDRGLRLREVVGLGDLEAHVGDDERDDAHERDREDREQQPQADALEPSLPAQRLLLAALAALAATGATLATGTLGGGRCRGRLRALGSRGRVHARRAPLGQAVRGLAVGGALAPRRGALRLRARGRARRAARRRLRGVGHRVNPRQ